MLRRKIDEKLRFWLKNRSQALLVTGARQIGKTFSIEHFIEKEFKNIVAIDFSKRPDLIDGFAFLENSKDLILRLSLVGGDKLIPHKTVVFFDEIQLLYQRRTEAKARGEREKPTQDLITAMKSVVQQGDFRFILSGSLLGVTLKDILLAPVGYLDEIRMHPLDFEEFLWAKGVGQPAIDHVKDCFEKRIPVDEGIHRAFLRAFREYVLVGGMPEAVATFFEKDNLHLVQEAHRQILLSYQSDITTYIEDDLLKLRTREVFKAIPSQLSSKNARFISSQVLDKQYLKHNPVGDEFLFLAAAGVAIPTYHVDEPVIPLSLSSKRKTLKLFLCDTGLLVSELVDTGIREKLLSGEKVINYGAPYENVAAQELVCHGFGDELFYYNSKRHGEVDFLLPFRGEVLPVEIKSGKEPNTQYYDRAALNNILDLYHHPLAFVFGESNVLREGESIYQLPIYMIDCLRR